MFCQYVLLWIFISEQKTEQISFHVIRHFCKSAPSSPSSPPFNHVLFCWKHLPPPVIAPTVSSVLYSPSFTLQLFFSFFFFFPHLLFCSHWAAFMEVLFGMCPPRSWTLHPLLPPHHFSPCSSIHMLRNQSALITHYIYRGEELQFLKENCGGIQASKGVSFCWINLGWERRSNLLFCEMNAPTSR